MTSSINSGWIQVNKIEPLVDSLRQSFASGRTKSYEWRRSQLEALLRLLEETRGEHLEAIRQDLGRNEFTFEIEYGGVVKEAQAALASLSGWMRPRRPSLPLAFQPGSAEIRPEPRGVVLLIAPWNYPFQLVYKPLIGALAAGNAVLIKPSEVSPCCDALLRSVVPRFLDPACVAVASGGVPETTELLRHRFDYIFYTGGGAVGRRVMHAAAEHLTPVTLELGGKSPAVVDRDCDLGVALKRIAWGRFMNSGQTCVAPDYLLVHRSLEQRVLEGLRDTIREFYGDDPQRSPDYSRVVSARHCQRLQALIEQGAHRVFCGGRVDPADRYVAPTVLTGVDPRDAVMQEEIFGPVLPVLPVDSVDEAVAFINGRPQPLALYVFSGSAETQRRVVEGTSSGSVCVNDSVLQVACPTLPFGGVGESGMGAYNGAYSFELFSHMRSVLHRPTWADPDIRYPPYNATKLRLFTLVNKIKLPSMRAFVICFVVPLLALLYYLLF